MERFVPGDSRGDFQIVFLWPLGIQGHSTVNDTMIIALESGVNGATLADTINKAIGDDDRVLDVTHEKQWSSYDDTTKRTSSAKSDKGGNARIVSGRSLDVFRTEATELIEQFISGGQFDQADGQSATTLQQSDSLTTLYQQAANQGDARGGYNPRRMAIMLGQKADMSTLLHEYGHYYLDLVSKLASSPNATAEMKADMQTILDWFGIKDVATWNAMTLEEKRQHHEAWAYNFEIYLFEGKAPSPELQAAFDKFSAWLKRVYVSIRDDLNAIYQNKFGKELPILTGEVRQVMDRLLATPEQIRRAEEIQNMKSLFLSQEESGMTNEEWIAFSEMQREASAAAVTDLNTASLRQMQWLSNAKSRLLKQMQSKHDEQRREVKDEVTSQVNGEPVYRATEFLKTGKVLDDKGEMITENQVHH